jgi:hypothetical protein
MCYRKKNTHPDCHIDENVRRNSFEEDLQPRGVYGSADSEGLDGRHIGIR